MNCPARWCRGSAGFRSRTAQTWRPSAAWWHYVWVSFDVFLQRFSAGQPSRADRVSVKALLDAYVVAEDHGRVQLETVDGSADLYGYDDLERGFMVNHAAGHAVWDLLVAVASMGPFAIMPVGCPTCVADVSMLSDLPSVLADGAVVVSSGSQLLRVIEQA